MMDVGDTKFGVYADKEMLLPLGVLHATFEDDGLDEAYTQRIYIGSPSALTFVHSSGEDIIITTGSRVYNLGKYIEGGKAKPLDIAVDYDTASVDISHIEIEWVTEHHDDITIAAWECNMSMLKTQYK